MYESKRKRHKRKTGGENGQNVTGKSKVMNKSNEEGGEIKMDRKGERKTGECKN